MKTPKPPKVKKQTKNKIPRMKNHPGYTKLPKNQTKTVGVSEAKAEAMLANRKRGAK